MKYWHLQMCLPQGRGGVKLDSMNMLQNIPSIIGTGEWDSYQCIDFKNTMKIGDIICVKEGQQAVALCEITSDNYTDLTLEKKFLHHNYRTIKLLDTNPSDTNFPQPQGTLSIAKDKNTASWKYINGWYNQYIRNQTMNKFISLVKSNRNLILTGAPGTGKTYLAKQIAKVMNAETEFVQFHPSYDYTDFVEGLRPVKKENSELGFELKAGVFKRFCEKAIQNLVDSAKSVEELSKEVDIENRINDFLFSAAEDEKEFELKQGNSFSIIKFDENYIEILIPKNKITSSLTIKVGQLKKLLIDNIKINSVKDVCNYFGRTHNAQSDSYIYILYKEIAKKIDKAEKISQRIEKKDFVIIIDEINRAEISKVFGELFYSIDPGYRGIDGKVKTQYANLQEIDEVFSDGFYVPENVYVIGTMNDIDRSVESMDFAMRRRFAWQEIKAEDRISMWDGKIDTWKVEAESRMRSLNKAVEEIQGLSSAYHIGPAYFLKLENYKKEKNPFECIWKNHLEGVIFEYLRGLPNSLELMENLKLAYNKDL